MRLCNTETQPAASAATGDDAEVIFTDLPESDEDGNYAEPPLDLWAEEEVVIDTIFLPLVNR